MTPFILYGTAWKKEQTTRLTDLAIQQGFRGIDTANQAKHYQEPLVGESVKKFLAYGGKREELFLQTKFTPIDGQDHRLPYNPEAPIREQVRQSFESSLKHLGVSYLDSYLLHGPYHHPGLGDEDWQVWAEMEKLFEEKKVRSIGISNVNPGQLALLISEATVKPMVVQNRCFARTGWDHGVREICREFKVTYQGFSLLTANPSAVGHAFTEAVADRLKVTPEQVIFAFARQIGMVPLTGTSDAGHMQQDLASREITLSSEELAQLEKIELR